MEIRFHEHFFPPLSNAVYEWVEWMWRMSEQSGCGQYLKRIRLKNVSYNILCVFVLY